MRIIYKLLIFATVMLALSGIVNGQTVIGTGAVNQLTYQKGGYGADSVMGLPVRDTFCNNFAAFRCAGRVTIQPGTFNVYINTGSYWKLIGAMGVPTLQQVTDVGSTTTHDISVGGVIASGDISAGSTMFTEDIFVNDEVILSNTASGEGNILVRNGSNVVKLSSINTASLLTDTIFISQIPGIHQNTNLNTGGGTDDRSLIQPILNLSSNNRSLVLIQDGKSLIDTTLLIGSNTTLICLENCGFYLDSGARCITLLNRNATENSPMVDSNISVIGGYWNCNGNNQLDATLGSLSASGTQIMGFQFSGVKNLKVRDVTIYDACFWGQAWINVKHGENTNYRHIVNYQDTVSITVTNPNQIPQLTRGKVRLSQDAISFRAGCEDIVNINTRSNASDDAITVNCIDYTVPDSFYQHRGIIKNILIKDTYLDSSALGVKIYSNDSLVENVVVDGVYGFSQWCAGGVSSNSGVAVINPFIGGNYRNIIFRNIKVTKVAPKPFTYNYNVPAFFTFDANMPEFTLENYQPYFADRYQTAIWTKAGFTINNFKLINYSEYDDLEASVDSPRILSLGRIKQFDISNAVWYRSPSISQRGRFMQNANTDYLNVNGLNFYNIDTGFTTTLGDNPKEVRIFNATMDSSDINGGLLDFPGYISSLEVVEANCEIGVSKLAIGSGVANMVNNSKIIKRTFGVEDWYDPRAAISTGSRGVRISSSAGNIDVVGDASGWVLSNGVLTPDRTTRLGGIHYAGSNTTLNTIRLGTSTASYAIGIVPATNAVDMPGALSVTGNTSVGGNLAVTGTTTSGAGTFTSTTDRVLLYRRDANTVGFGWSIIGQIKNASGNYVDATAVSSTYAANTVGATAAHMDLYSSTAGALSLNQRIWNNGNVTIQTGGTYTNNGFKLEVVGTARITGNLSLSAKILSYNNTPPTDGQLLIGHTSNSTFEKATLTAGTNISVTNGAGSITIATSATPTFTNITLSGIVEYADNAAAITGGLTAGQLYRTGDVLKIVH